MEELAKRLRRYREFYQFGFEAFGSSDAMMDAEVIGIVCNLFKILGLKGVSVNINTLGDEESRNETIKGLNSAKGFIKKEIAKAIDLRIMPELEFISDTSIEDSMKLYEIIDSLNDKDE